jgi:hypothetical protein
LIKPLSAFFIMYSVLELHFKSSSILILIVHNYTTFHGTFHYYLVVFLIYSSESRLAFSCSLPIQFHSLIICFLPYTVYIPLGGELYQWLRTLWYRLRALPYRGLRGHLTSVPVRLV